jgi:internalin A
MILPESARKRGEVVERLDETLRKEGWNIIRDKNAMRSGDLISGFMKRIGLADRVIVVLSEKYLHSPYCMTELYSIYQRTVGEKEHFLRRIIPLVFADARFRTWRDRLVYTTYWRTEFEEMEKHFKDLGEMDFGSINPCRSGTTGLQTYLHTSTTFCAHTASTRL